MNDPQIKLLKRALREQIIHQYGNITLEDVDMAILHADMAGIFSRVVRSVGVQIADGMRPVIIKQVLHDLAGWGPLQDLMDDALVTEIMVNGPDSIYCERAGKTLQCDIGFDDETHLRYIIEKMIRPSGRRVDELYPFVDFSLANGSRVNVIIPPCGFGGPYVTIRKFLHDLKTLDKLIDIGTMDEKIATFLRACVRGKVNLMFSGATGSGKTTLLEILSSDIGEDERIVTIEDTLELHLRQNHVVRLLTRNPNIEGKGEITIRELFVNTLRMRPDRIILGEIRGGEALDYLQACNSGHEGSMAVIHASSPDDVVVRMENMAFYSGLNIPASSIRMQIAHGINIVVQLAQIIDGTRKVVKVSEITENAERGIDVKHIFMYKGDRMDEDGRIQGHFSATGYLPEALEQIKDMHVHVPMEIFTRTA
jgi:pilus assembly protein CpaF